MAAANHRIDLDQLGLSPGQGTRLERDVDPGELELGGSPYAFAEGGVHARVDLSRTSTGYAMRLRFAGALAGPCVRCLEPAVLAIEIDVREVDQPASHDEELLSPYVSEGVLDLTAWAHDAVVLALPDKILCSADCAGLCPECGRDLNVEPHQHAAEIVDPRWAALAELRDRL